MNVPEILALRAEARAAGDYLMSSICEAALAGDPLAMRECDRVRAGAAFMDLVFCERCPGLAVADSEGPSLCAACRALDPLDVEWSANERTALPSDAESHDCAAITAARFTLSPGPTRYGHQIRICCACGVRVKLWNIGPRK